MKDKGVIFCTIIKRFAEISERVGVKGMFYNNACVI